MQALDDGIDKELLAALEDPQWDEDHPTQVLEQGTRHESMDVQQQHAQALEPAGPSAPTSEPASCTEAAAPSSVLTAVQPQPQPHALLLRLPKELLLRIWAFLSVDELCKSALICPACKQLSEEQILWRRLFCARWGKPAQQEEASWKVLYQSKDAEERQSIAKMCDAGPQDPHMLQMYRDMQRARRQQALGRGHIDDTAEVPLSTIQARLDAWRRTYPPVPDGQPPRCYSGAATANKEQHAPHSVSQPVQPAGPVGVGQPSGSSTSVKNSQQGPAAPGALGLSEAVALITSPKRPSAHQPTISQGAGPSQDAATHNEGAGKKSFVSSSKQSSSGDGSQSCQPEQLLGGATGGGQATAAAMAAGPTSQLPGRGEDDHWSAATLHLEVSAGSHTHDAHASTHKRQRCGPSLVDQHLQSHLQQHSQHQQQPQQHYQLHHQLQSHPYQQTSQMQTHVQQPHLAGMPTAAPSADSKHMAARRPVGRRVVQRRGVSTGVGTAVQRSVGVGGVAVGQPGSHPITRAWLERQEACRPDLSKGRDAFTWDQIGDYFCCRETGWIHLCDHSCRECIIDRTHDLLVCPISCRTVDRMLTEWELQMLDRTHAGPVGHDEADFGGFMGRAYEAGYSCRNDSEFKRMLAGKGWRLK